MIDKKRIKDIANELGAYVVFDSNNPGFYSKSNKEFYSFFDLNQIIDNVFPMNNEEHQRFLNSKECREIKTLTRNYSDKQIWNNKPLIEVIKRLSDE